MAGTRPEPWAVVISETSPAARHETLASVVGTLRVVEHLDLGRSARIGGGCQWRVDADGVSNIRLRFVLGGSRMTEERLASLYESDGFGGEKTMRAKVIRELIDEIRRLRRELADAGRQGRA